MRQLKFRVWNGAEMIYDVMVGKFGVFYVNPGDKDNGLDPKDSASLTPFNTKYHEDTPVMQFTGLYDKNGKEIYEGDILKNETSDVLGSVVWNNDLSLFELSIKLDGEEFCTTIYSHREGDNNMKREIVGDVYKNTDLLK